MHTRTLNISRNLLVVLAAAMVVLSGPLGGFDSPTQPAKPSRHKPGSVLNKSKTIARALAPFLPRHRRNRTQVLPKPLLSLSHRLLSPTAIELNARWVFRPLLC